MQKLASDIQVLDSERDTEDRIMILKTMIKNELITRVAFYDTIKNKDSHLKEIKTLLRKIDSSQGFIIGSDRNNFTDRICDQRGNRAEQKPPWYTWTGRLTTSSWASKD